VLDYIKILPIFKQKLVQTLKFMAFIWEVHDSNVILTVCISWHFCMVFLSRPRQISM